MATVCVGVDSKANVEIDIADDGLNWEFHTLSPDEASFLYEELGSALARALARKATLDSRKAAPKETPPP